MTTEISRQYKMNYFDPEENSNKVWIGLAYDDGAFESRLGACATARIWRLKGKT